MGKARRGRTERRQGERGARKLVRLQQELAALEPGGSGERPLEVPISSVIEGRAASTPCPLCAGRLRVDQHRVETVSGKSVRAVDVTCLQCGISRVIWFRITGSGSA